MDYHGIPPSDLGIILDPDPANKKVPHKGHLVNGKINPKPLADLDEARESGLPYGIRLDGKYVLYDIDDMSKAPKDLNLPRTWSQRTRRGMHYVFHLPEGINVSDLTNGYLINDKGEKYGDLKFKGHFVGPGSTYDGFTYAPEDITDFAPAPAHLLVPKRKKTATSIAETNGIYENHDNSLKALAGFGRGRLGLDEEGMRVLLRGALPLLRNVDESRPYTEADIVRLSKPEYEATYQIPSDSPDARTGLEKLFDSPVFLEPQEWIINDFIPMRDMSLVYGSGGIGKSTLASYVLRECALKGQKVGFVVIEERKELFGARMLFGGGFTKEAQDNVYVLPSSLSFPKDIGRLSDLIDEVGLDLVYLDSVYTHFDPSIQGNEATRARLALGSLAHMAQTKNVTVLGLLHENKSGTYLGSVEVRNVCRTLVHASQDGKSKLLKLKVDKSNYEVPEYALLCESDKFHLKDQHGNQWQKRTAKGEMLDRQAFGITGFTEIGDDTEVYEIEPEVERDDVLERIRTEKRNNPAKTVRALMEEFGVKKWKVEMALKG